MTRKLIRKVSRGKEAPVQEEVEVTKTPKKDAKKSKASMPVESIEVLIEELSNVKTHMKDLKAREKELRDKVDVVLQAEGSQDSKGNFKMVIGDILAQRQAKKSIKINPNKAEEYLKKKGLWEGLSDEVRILNETRLEEKVQEGVISVKDLESITSVKTTYAIVLGEYKPEEEMPTVEVSK